jgi:hypothetical protein
MKVRPGLIFILVLQGILGFSQESNYANYEVGSKSTMLGGAVVAGIDNISSAYYNPGALSFINNSSVSLETSTLFTGGLNIKNGAGRDIDIRSSFFDVIPSLIGGIVKNQKDPSWTFAYAAITVNSSLIEYNVRHFLVADIINSSPGDEFYDGGYDYRNKISENWLGIAVSRKISERFGLGATIFGASFYQDFHRSQLAIVTGDVNGTPTTLASTTISQYMRFRSLALIVKLGLNYQHEKHQFGFTITTPKMNIDLFAKGTISSDIQIVDPLNIGAAQSVVFYGDDLSTYHRTPLKLDFGYQIEMPSSQLMFRLSYNTQVKQYAMLSSNEVTVPQVGLVRPSISAYDMANQVFNFSVGYRDDVSEGLSVLVGAKTDFNFVDAEFLNQQAFIPKMSYWDLYHVTGGVIWYNQRAHLTLGADYAFGISKNDLQRVNLSDPVPEELYFGQRTTDTRTFHNQVYVVFGFMFKFLE